MNMPRVESSFIQLAGGIDMPRVESSFIQLAGGIDMVSAATLIKPGFCFDALNYEIDSVNGGYARINGYERYDGRPSPTAADYWLLAISGTAPAIGATITGGTSGHTAKVLAIAGSTLVVGRATGTFTVGESIGGGATVAASALINSESDGATDAAYRLLSADDRRADIQAVPGSGSILGVAEYKGVIYAFRNNVGGTAAVMYKATSSGWTAVTTPALQPSGRYEFVVHNFIGSTNGQKLYGCDGKNKAFMFDGTTFTQITTGMASDTPSHIAVHANHLFLAFGGSLQNSALGDPTSWTLLSGASEIGVGDTITALLNQPGDATTSALHVFSSGSTHTLYGKSSADWKMVMDSPTTGAAVGTAQHIGTAYVLAERGIQQIGTTNAFGDFLFASVSGLIQPMINRLNGTAVASAAYKSRNQYRVFYADGSAIAMTVMGNSPVGMMSISYPAPVTCYLVTEDSSGNEICYFGSSDGYVYQDNIGTSFDGAVIDAALRLPFNHFGSPRYRKTFRRAMLDASAAGYSQVSVSYDLGSGSFYVESGASQTFSQSLSGGFWDQFIWEDFSWDSPAVSNPTIELTGTEKNISILFYSSSNLYAAHVIQGITFNYTVRRLER